LVRRGSWRTVYLWAAAYHLLGRFGSHEVVVDVQNAVPFFSPLYCGRRVVVLVHHVHREQWEILFGSRVARVGWWVESRLAPWLYRRSRYIAVSNSTREDLAALGVDPERIRVVRNGSTDRGWDEPAARAPRPVLTYLGRLVPHKRIELLLDAAARLRHDFPELRVQVIGQGSWMPQLRERASELGIEDRVDFEGFVDGDAKRRMLERTWVLVQPSVKEGWGLSVVEAASAGTPAVAFRVGGLTESIVDGETGLLASGFEEFVSALRRLLASEDLRASLGRAARARAAEYTWEATAEGVLAALALDEPAAATTPSPVAEPA
jgi:glycosyltransferase involved in cell wall biosynthesis